MSTNSLFLPLELFLPLFFTATPPYQSNALSSRGDFHGACNRLPFSLYYSPPPSFPLPPSPRPESFRDVVPRGLTGSQTSFPLGDFLPSPLFLLWETVHFFPFLPLTGFFLIPDTFLRGDGYPGLRFCSSLTCFHPQLLYISFFRPPATLPTDMQSVFERVGPCDGVSDFLKEPRFTPPLPPVFYSLSYYSGVPLPSSYHITYFPKTPQPPIRPPIF